VLPKLREENERAAGKGKKKRVYEMWSKECEYAVYLEPGSCGMASLSIWNARGLRERKAAGACRKLAYRMLRDLDLVRLYDAGTIKGITESLWESQGVRAPCDCVPFQPQTIRGSPSF